MHCFERQITLTYGTGLFKYEDRQESEIVHEDIKNIEKLEHGKSCCW